MRHFFRFIISWIIPVVLSGSQSFTATTNTVVTSPGVSIPLTGTVSVAVFPTYSQNDGLYHIMFESILTAGVNQFSLIKGAANTIYIEIDNSSGLVYSPIAAPGSFTLPTSQWSVVTATWTNGGDIFVYLNGFVIASSSTSGVPSLSWTGTGTQSWSIGNRSTGGFDQRGSEALVGLWSRVLTQQEIVALSLRFAPNAIAPSGLVSDWNLTGSSLVDSVGGHNLTASGTSTGSDPTHINLGASASASPWIGFK